MDNRLIFLYHMISELWGRKERMEEPGMEKRIMCPYRKPTQVDEERILRPAGEVLLRNSAK